MYVIQSNNCPWEISSSIGSCREIFTGLARGKGSGVEDRELLNEADPRDTPSDTGDSSRAGSLLLTCKGDHSG
jgi:hypothetical protein